MGRPVYVYHLAGPAEVLRAKVLAYLGSQVCFWVADMADIAVNEGLPEAWGDRGAVFNQHGELRWWRRDAGYEALLLSEKAIPETDLTPVSGEWQGEDCEVFLQHLGEPRVAPPFSVYPGIGTTGKLRVTICWRDGVPTFVSPRQFLQGGEQ